MVEKIEGRDHWEDIAVEGTIIL